MRLTALFLTLVLLTGFAGCASGMATFFYGAGISHEKPLIDWDKEPPTAEDVQDPTYATEIDNYTEGK